MIEETVKYLTECIAVNVLAASLLVAYSAFYVWYYWDLLDMDELYDQFLIELVLVMACCVLVPLSLV